MNGVGIVAGLSTALLWTATALCFEISSRRLGSWAVNVLRLLAATGLFVGLSCIRHGRALPAHLTESMWRDLILSGCIGFVVGDLLLFEAFVLIGARLSMLIYASVPVMTSVAGWLVLDESMSSRSLVGMGITMSGIGAAILSKPEAATRHAPEPAVSAADAANPKPEAATRHAPEPAVSAADAANRHRRGVAFAIGASAGQAAGLLLGKRGSVGLDSFSATQVRVIAGVLGLLILSVVLRRLQSVFSPVATAFGPVSDPSAEAFHARSGVRKALILMLIGSLLGPFLGVSLGLLSTQLLPVGVASTLMSIVPALLVPASAFLFRETIRLREVTGTALALVGIAVLSL